MYRELLTALFTILSFAGYAQIKYDSAYFVTNDGHRVDCLIKNVDWYFNPTEFLYKKSENGTIEKATIAEVREFGILNFSRYERFDADVDTATDQPDHLDDKSKPEYKRATIFLKVLAEGKATLYEYRSQNMTRYYFKTDSIRFTPLVHKVYLAASDKSDILENNSFRNQLFFALQSPELDESHFERLSYSENSLAKVFEVYNGSGRSAAKNFVFKHSKGQFHLNFRVGADLTGETVNFNPGNQATTRYGNKLAATVGLEAEYVLGFNGHRWAAVLQPSYHYYRSDLGPTSSVDYKLLETGIGGRHYFFIGKDSKLFVTALALMDATIGSGAIVDEGYTLNYRPFSFGAALSAGYKYKNRWSMELQYTLVDNILDYYVYFQSNCHTTSLVFAYTIL